MLKMIRNVHVLLCIPKLKLARNGLQKFLIWLWVLYIDGLAQGCSKSSALVTELLQCCVKHSVFWHILAFVKKKPDVLSWELLGSQMCELVSENVHISWNLTGSSSTLSRGRLSNFQKFVNLIRTSLPGRNNTLIYCQLNFKLQIWCKTKTISNQENTFEHVESIVRKMAPIFHRSWYVKYTYIM